MATSGGTSQEWTSRRYQPEDLWAFLPLQGLTPEQQHSLVGDAAVDDPNSRQATIIDALINRSRPFIFATAPSPFNAALVRAMISVLKADSSLIDAAQERLRHAHAEARRFGVPNDVLNSQIIPVILGDDGRTMEMAATLAENGFDVRGIRPPTVPRGTSRLRISITGNVSKAEISALFETLNRYQRKAA